MSRCSRSPPTRSTPRSRLPTSGTLLEIRVQEDETVEIGAVLAVIGEQAGAAQPQPEPQTEAQPEPEPEPEAKQAPEPEPEQPSAPEPEPQAAEPEPEPAPTPKPAAQPAAATASPAGGGDGEAAGYVTPLVRKLAREHNVDLASLSGTGVGGRVRKQDVLAAAEAAKEAAKKAAEAPPPAAAPQRPRQSPPQPPAPAPCAAPPRRCPGCARPSPSGWSSRSRSPHS